DFRIDLLLRPKKPPLIHGTNGVSRKGEAPEQASHYYSFSRMATTGTLSVGRKEFAVRGTSWMDHEFGSGDLGDKLVGWDWFSIQLENGTEVMLYRLRRDDGTADPASSGTVSFPDGRTEHLKASDVRVSVLDYWTSHGSGARYPSRWRIAVPAQKLHLIVTPQLADQELVTRRSTQVTYWEGAVLATGTFRDASVGGHGYVELTGYAQPLSSQPWTSSAEKEPRP
ncbi:MAG: lipocalin family protein, partial [Nitrospiraceae bacterium]